jgi:spore coat protein U-like protein
MRTRTLVSVCLVIAGIALSGGSAEAATCSISTTPVSFGTYDVFTPASVDSVGSVILNCNGGKNIVVSINPGQAGTFSPRKMLMNASEWLGYNLYRDASRSVVWGDGTGGTSFASIPSLPNNQDTSVPIYGSVPPGQDVRAGSYADSLSVTINF